ncbi:MAG: UvrD-helicase domain-containing protein [Euryarchaeota archaeon]|nr:UvrD-helicase domain-containing protein [Euryarchaeota archaeon]
MSAEYDRTSRSEDIDTAVTRHRDTGVGIKDALLYTSSISQAKDSNITIKMLEEFAGQKKEAIIPVEPDCDRWEEIFRENSTKINTFHLLDKPGHKTQRDDTKRWTAFNDLYQEYSKYRDFLQAWTQYETRKRQRNALDYGDPNTKALQFLNTYDAGQSADMYRHIIIDEFQDTNNVPEFERYIGSYAPLVFLHNGFRFPSPPVFSVSQDFIISIYSRTTYPGRPVKKRYPQFVVTRHI